MLLSVCVCALLPAAAQAHTVRPVVVTMQVENSGRVDIQIRANAEAILAGIPPEYSDTNDAPNAAEYDALRALPDAQLAARFDRFGPVYAAKPELLADGRRVALQYAEIEVVPEPELELTRTSNIYLQAQLPPDTKSVVWVWPEEYGSNVLRLGRADNTETYSAWLKQGQASDEFSLRRDGVVRGRLAVALDYAVIGFQHIVPKGLDHILFVLGLFLLSTRLGPLLWQVTAFTVAHTITLGLSIYGVVSAPSSFVEPLIALSIAYVGIENCLSSKLKPWRVVLVFCFGLLHGMGFAGVLSEIGLPRSEFITALISFNVGVEFGQLAVILLGFAAFGWWRKRSWYRQRIVIPASLLIAAVGFYWTWERVFA